MAASTSHLDVLMNLGFQRAAEWHVETDRLRCKLDQPTGMLFEVLYAFVIGEEVVYVGKTAVALANRMQHYCTPGPSQRTNIANNARIRAVLDQGKSVELWVLKPESMTYRGLPLNVAAGLEDPLIAAIKPAWNGNAKGDSAGTRLP